MRSFALEIQTEFMLPDFFEFSGILSIMIVRMGKVKKSMKFKESKKVELKKSTALPTPVYEEIGSSFVVTFKKSLSKNKLVHSSTEKSSEKGSEKTSEKILKLIAKYPHISTQEMGNQIGVSSRAIEKQLTRTLRCPIL